MAESEMKSSPYSIQNKRSPTHRSRKRTKRRGMMMLKASTSHDPTKPGRAAPQRGARKLPSCRALTPTPTSSLQVSAPKGDDSGGIKAAVHSTDHPSGGDGLSSQPSTSSSATNPPAHQARGTQHESVDQQSTSGSLALSSPNVPPLPSSFASSSLSFSAPCTMSSLSRGVRASFLRLPSQRTPKKKRRRTGQFQAAIAASAPLDPQSSHSSNPALKQSLSYLLPLSRSYSPSPRRGDQANADRQPGDSATRPHINGENVRNNINGDSEGGGREGGETPLEPGAITLKPPVLASSSVASSPLTGLVSILKGASSPSPSRLKRPRYTHSRAHAFTSPFSPAARLSVSSEYETDRITRINTNLNQKGGSLKIKAMKLSKLSRSNLNHRGSSYARTCRNKQRKQRSSQASHSIHTPQAQSFHMSRQLRNSRGSRRASLLSSSPSSLTPSGKATAYSLSFSPASRLSCAQTDKQITAPSTPSFSFSPYLILPGSTDHFRPDIRPTRPSTLSVQKGVQCMRKREGELERERERSRESKTGRKNKYERRERRVRFRLISAKGDIFFVRAGEHEQEEEEEKKKKKQEQNQEQNQKRADGLCLTKAALLPSCSSNYSLSPPPPQSLSKLTPASLVNPDISDSTETLDLMAEAREEVNGTVSEIYAKEDAKDKTNEVYEGKEIIESTVGEREDMAEEKKKYFKRQKDEAPESVEMSIVKPFSSLSHCTFHSPPAHSISKLRTRSFNHYDDHKFHSGTAAVKTSANICDKDSDGDGDDIHLNSYNDVYKDDDDDGIAPKMIVFGDSDSASFTLNTLTPPNLGPSSPSHPPSLSASHSPSASAVAESGEEASEGSSAVQSSTSSDSFAKSPALDKDGNSGGNIKNDDNNDNNSRARVGFGCSAVQSTSTQGAGGERGLESENQDNTKSYGCSKKLPLLTPLVSPSSPLPKSSPLSHPMGGSGSNANVRRSLRLILNDDSLPPTTLPPSSSSPVSSSSPLLVSSLSMPYPLSPLLSAFQSKIKRAASFFLGSSDTKQPKKTQDVAEKEDDGVDEPVDVDVTGEEDYRLEVQEQNGNDHQTEASTEAHRGAMVEAIDQLAEMEVDAEAEAEAAAAEEVKAMSEERDETEEAVLRACKQFSRLASTFASGAGCFHMPALHLRDGEEIEDRHHIEHTRMDEEKDRDCIVAAAADIEAETAPGSECECEDWQEERGFEACLHMFSEDIFRVERLIKHRGKGQRKQYLVKWLGYNDSENTWELRENLLCGGEDLIAEYEYNLQLKQKHIKRRKRKRSYTL